MAETFRKAMVEVLVPEIRDLRQEMHENITGLRQEMQTGFHEVRESVDQLRLGQERILARLDLDQRVTRLETLVEQFRKA